MGLAIGGLGCGGVDGRCRRDRRGWGGFGGERSDGLDQEVVPGQAGVPFAALGIEDPERRSPARRSVPVMGDHGLGPLSDDVPTQPDPRPTSQLEPDAGRLVHGRDERPEPGSIEDQQQGLGPTGERGEAVEPIGDAGRGVRASQPATGQIQDEQVHRPTGEQAPGDREPLVQAGRGDDDEPFETDPTRHGFDGVEGPRQVQPGHDRAASLGLCGGPQGQGGPAAGAIAADGDAGRGREAARAQDRVERREPRSDDPVAGERRLDGP